jgi:hypothetical protein
MGLHPVKRLTIFIVIAGGLAGFLTVMPVLEAQTPAARKAALVADQNQASITVTGCLLLGPYGDYTLSKTIVATGEVLNAVAWKLEGNRELLGHILEKIEVTGTMQPMPLDPDTTAVTNRPADRGRAASYRLRVKSIKKLFGGCS